MSQRMSSLGSSMQGVGNTLTRNVSLPLAGVGAAVIKMGADFQYQMARVKNISQSSGADFEMLRAQAKKLGAETQYSATQAAEGMEFLAMAGFKPKEIYEAMPAVLNGAAAANMDLGRTADIVSNIMTGYQMKASEASTATDILTKAAQSANVDVDMLGESFKYGGSMAKASGLSVTEAASAFALLGNAGLQGSMGGTAVGAMLRAIQKPSRKAANLQKELGLSFMDAKGNMLPFTQVLEKLQKKTLTAAQANIIFGTEGARAYSALKDQGVDAFKKLDKSLRDSKGTTDRFAEDMGKTAKAGMFGFTSALEGLAIAISESGVLDAFTAILGKVTEFVRGLTDTSPQILKWAFTLGAITAAIGPMLKIGGLLFGWLGKVGPAISAVTTAVRGLNLAFMANPIVLVVAAIAALVAGIIVAYNKCAPFREAVDKLFSALKAGFDVVMTALQPVFDAVKRVFAQLMDSSSQMWAKIQPILSQLGALFSTTMSLIGTVVSAAVEIIEAIWNRWGDDILGMVKGVWEMISSVIQGALGVIQGIIKTVTSLITGDWSGAWDGIKLIVTSVWDAIGGVISGALTFLENLISIAWDAISSVTSSVWDGIVDFVKSIPGRIVSFFLNWTLVGLIIKHWDSIKDGTIRVASNMLDWVRGLPGRIVGYFGDFGSMLYDKGMDLIRGLWNGIKSMGAWLRDTLAGWAADMIPGPIARALGIRSPSRLMRDRIGKFIPAGVVEGVKLGKPAIERVMRDLVPTPAMPGVAQFADDWTAPIVDAASRAEGLTLKAPNVGTLAPRTPEAPAPWSGAGGRGGAGITVYAQTSADPHEIGREVAWAVRTAGH
ncbi:phage tail tape measure protein [Streptomyces sp. A1-5]|uniref:phage tail tape measure protein n=1 Tax=Streptomyces sp. A1-5 TaxID=2738410 RepID=UPI001F33E563|nr:phage tail tape measure protein [Streptomyces sp. A1-5]UJB43604.1 phage tail tape measure protein [Streptomyces sp. A1-5]